MLTSIAKVNRHFRRLASPYLFSEVRVPSYSLLPSALFDRFGPHLSQIASIRVGHPPLRVLLSKNCPNLNFPTNLEYARLHILARFDCVGFCFQPKELTEVFGASNSQLRSLRLGWDGGWLFPFDSFPALENLFALIYAHEPRSYDPHPRVFPSLTTLSIMDNNMGFFETKICGQATFPNLRTFRLQSRPTFRHNRLFGFISDHTTILDVDIPEIYVDFLTFAQLARGDRNKNSTGQYLGGLGEFPSFVECTKLSLVISDPGDEVEDPALESIESMMRVLGESLARWKNLRHLYLECTSPELDDDLRWMDDPWQELDDCGHHPYCEHWCDEVEEWQQFFFEDDMECHDDSCSMQLWKATHEHDMVSCMRRLASACITLEVFKWRIRSQEFHTELLWRWNIHRYTNGAVRLVSGHLTWTGLPTHPPPHPDEPFNQYKV
ncbi:hypothetical protein B0H19DRAFT_1371782 [Mycena capillaripes]|nr:hypothetical protein B0H19DRAFT_1371782 [Mycena capillaripes]